MSDTSNETKTSRLPLILIVSVVLNALLIGFVLGGGLKARGGGKGPAGPHGGGEALIIRSIERQLPQDERKAVREARRKAFRETRPARREHLKARREMMRLLAAEELDKEALETVLTKIRQAEDAGKARLHRELLVQIEGLSLEQRREAVKTWKRLERERGRERRGPQAGSDDRPRREGPPRE